MPAGATFTNTGTLTAESNDNDPTLSGNFVNGGTLSIKANTQLEQAVGTFTNAGGGTLSPQISGSSFGEVRIDSEASFVAGGTLAPVVIEGFVPTVGQEFHVVAHPRRQLERRVRGGRQRLRGRLSNSGFIGAIYGGGVTGPAPAPTPISAAAPVPVPATALVTSLTGGVGAFTIKLSCPVGAANCARTRSWPPSPSTCGTAS